MCVGEGAEGADCRVVSESNGNGGENTEETVRE